MKSPILNSPYFEPNRHFSADERGLTEEIVDFRRTSSFYIPVPRAKTKQVQLDLNLAQGASSHCLLLRSVLSDLSKKASR